MIKTTSKILSNLNLGQDFDEKEYNKDFKDNENFLKDFHPDKIRGLLFVATEKQTKWPNFIKQKRTVRKVYPLPLRITIDVKQPTAEVIPPEISQPVFERIYTDEQVGVSYVKDEILVGFKRGTSETRIKEIIREINGAFFGSIPDLGLYQILVQVSNPSELGPIIQQLETYPEVGLATYSWVEEAF